MFDWMEHHVRITESGRLAEHLRHYHERESSGHKQPRIAHGMDVAWHERAHQKEPQPKSHR